MPAVTENAFTPYSFDDSLTSIFELTGDAAPELAEAKDRNIDVVEPMDTQADVADLQQRAFIDSPASTLRLVAPAGSDKTNSVVLRVKRLLAAGTPPGKVDLLTFDNAAKSSLTERMNTVVGERNAPRVSTLNGWGSRTLQRADPSLLPPYFREPDEHEKAQFVLLEGGKAGATSPMSWPRMFPRRLTSASSRGSRTLQSSPTLFGEVSRFPKDQVARLLHMFEKQAVDAQWQELAAAQNPPVAPKDVRVLLLNLYAEYCRAVYDRGRIDFDDQKMLPLFLAIERGMALDAGYRDAVVDEFQDLNYLDFELIRRIAKGANLVVVGDDDQAIYDFRGCSPDYLINLDRHLEREVETVVLERNYRCPVGIVQPASRLNSRNTNRIPTNIVAAKDDSVTLEVWSTADSVSEAIVVANTIRKLAAHPQTPVPYSQMAVLYRNNVQGLPIQIRLVAEDIPYISRKQDYILLSQELERLLAVLEFREAAISGEFIHPDHVSVVLGCVHPFLRRGSERVYRSLRDGDTLTEFEPAIRSLTDVPPATRNEEVEGMRGLLAARSTASAASAALRHFPYISKHRESDEGSDPMFAPHGEFETVARRFGGSVTDFVNRMQELKRLVECDEGWEDTNAVYLGSYFRAKGKQWHTVFLPGCVQTVIPGRAPDSEVERRLFYVGMTRASSNLFVSYTRNYQNNAAVRSQFSDEAGLPEAMSRRAV